jgi:uncharacterized RDD family membrane protein YckC
MMSSLSPPGPAQAGLGRRLAALVYDALLLFGILALATLLIMPLTRGAVRPGDAFYPYYAGYLLLIGFGFFGWFWTHGGQTLGMRAWRIRLQRYDGAAVTWIQAGIRFLVAGLWVLPMGYSAKLGRPVAISLATGFATLAVILLTRSHDLLARTVVIRVPRCDQRSRSKA